MPELPEVETIARSLRLGGRGSPPVVGRTIQGAELLWARSLETPSAAQFLAQVHGQTIQEIGRRGKFLLFWLVTDCLLIHLRMSGDILVESDTAPLAPHHRLTLDLDGGLRLAFNDPRKFGRVWLVGDPDEVLAALGPEPLEDEFTALDFFQRLQSRRRQLKPLLLDQTFLAGLGNIYTDEALHLAKLHPATVSSQLNQGQAETLLCAIREVLHEGIRRQGASIDWVYRGGNFQNYFRVYQRAGEPCPVCGAAIQRIVIGQRGTHFCPVCQSAPVGR